MTITADDRIILERYLRVGQVIDLLHEDDEVPPGSRTLSLTDGFLPSQAKSLPRECRFNRPVDRRQDVAHTYVTMYPLADRVIPGPALWFCAALVAAAALLLLARRGRGPTTDRRADPRRAGAPVPIWLLDDAGDVTGRGLVLDRSARGVRLAVDEPYAVGAVLRVLPLDTPAGAAPVTAEVRWCRRGGPRTEVGCRFTDPSSAEALRLT